MQIKIIKCSDSLYWYSKKIGFIFNAHMVTREGLSVKYWVKTDDEYRTTNFILDKDCEVIGD